MGELEGQIGSIPEVLAGCVAGAEGPIAEAAKAWHEAKPAAVFTIARGTSDAAACHAARLFTLRLGVAACSFSPSLATMHGYRHGGKGAVALAISQSGESPDLVAALKAFEPGSRWALTNVDGTPLEKESSVRIPMGAGVEKSVAATKSFACSLVQLTALVSKIEGNEVFEVDSCVAAAKEGLANPMPLDILEKTQGAFVIGRGATMAVALEAALKLKETAGLHAEASSSAEVMHGPKALAGPNMPVVAFAPAGEAGRAVEAAVGELADLGSPTVLFGAREGETELETALRLIVSFYAALPDLARRRGLDPDSPRALTKVTRTL